VEPDVKIRTVRTGPGPLLLTPDQTLSEWILNCCRSSGVGAVTLSRHSRPFGGKKIICVSLLTDINDKTARYQQAGIFGPACLQILQPD
jgi:hypothetical protein